MAELRSAQHAARVQALFDHMAAGWAARYASDGSLTGRPAQFAAAVSYHLPAHGRVLDLGCGTGEVARYLATSGRLVAGCDIAPRMLRQARAAPPQPGACWFQVAADWRTLPLRPASLDGIVAASVLEYVGYLQTSRHRRSAEWWSAAAARAGLHTVERPAGGARRAPLRLLTFPRPGLATQAPGHLQEVE